MTNWTILEDGLTEEVTANAMQRDVPKTSTRRAFSNIENSVQPETAKSRLKSKKPKSSNSVKVPVKDSMENVSYCISIDAENDHTEVVTALLDLSTRAKVCQGNSSCTHLPSKKCAYGCCKYCCPQTGDTTCKFHLQLLSMCQHVGCKKKCSPKCSFGCCGDCCHDVTTLGRECEYHRKKQQKIVDKERTLCVSQPFADGTVGRKCNGHEGCSKLVSKKCAFGQCGDCCQGCSFHNSDFRKRCKGSTECKKRVSMKCSLELCGDCCTGCDFHATCSNQGDQEKSTAIERSLIPEEALRAVEDADMYHRNLGDHHDNLSFAHDGVYSVVNADNTVLRDDLSEYTAEREEQPYEFEANVDDISEVHADETDSYRWYVCGVDDKTENILLRSTSYEEVLDDDSLLFTSIDIDENNLDTACTVLTEDKYFETVVVDSSSLPPNQKRSLLQRVCKKARRMSMARKMASAQSVSA